jgi:hypothetical protein
MSLMRLSRDIPAHPGWQEANGGYNDFPPNWHEITPEQFAKSDFFGWHADIMEHRQMVPKTAGMKVLMRLKDGQEGCAVTANLYWMPSGLGYSIVNDFWGGQIRLFKFGTQNPDWLKGIDSSD